ncbi:hypothetical protein AAFF_G00135070, partial [Aldrovandia affinis]
ATFPNLRGLGPARRAGSGLRPRPGLHDPSSTAQWQIPPQGIPGCKGSPSGHASAAPALSWRPLPAASWRPLLERHMVLHAGTVAAGPQGNGARPCCAAPVPACLPLRLQLPAPSQPARQ